MSLEYLELFRGCFSRCNYPHESLQFRIRGSSNGQRLNNGVRSRKCLLYHSLSGSLLRHMQISLLLVVRLLSMGSLWLGRNNKTRRWGRDNELWGWQLPQWPQHPRRGRRKCLLGWDIRISWLMGPSIWMRGMLRSIYILRPRSHCHRRCRSWWLGLGLELLLRRGLGNFHRLQHPKQPYLKFVGFAAQGTVPELGHTVPRGVLLYLDWVQLS